MTRAGISWSVLMQSFPNSAADIYRQLEYETTKAHGATITS